MSAWLCTQRHISAVVNAAGNTHSTLRMSGGEAFKILAEANAKSVDYRYDECESSIAVSGYRYDPMARVKPVEALKAVHCLEYQSCEVPDWENTEAKKLLDTIESHIVRTLPGYEAAPWGLDDAPHSGAVSLLDIEIGSYTTILCRACEAIVWDESGLHNDEDHVHECATREDDACEARGYCQCACGCVRDWDAGMPVPAKDGGVWLSGEGR